MRLVAILAVVLGLSFPASACRLALVLGLDVSASVSEIEYRIQLIGLARALEDPEVAKRLVGGAGNEVDLLIFEWGSPDYQRVLQEWARIDSEAQLAGIAARLRTWNRVRFGESTAIGRAMLYAAGRLRERRDCAEHTVDLSGDGKSNVGPRPQDLKAQLDARGVTVNGLVIETRNIAELSAYYHANVIVGPFAFVETAGGFNDYGRAIKRKLLRELTAPVAGLSRVPSDG